MGGMLAHGAALHSRCRRELTRVPKLQKRMGAKRFFAAAGPSDLG
jgi:hypothetical protein